jgi:hypothetical protein
MTANPYFVCSVTHTQDTTLKLDSHTLTFLMVLFSVATDSLVDGVPVSLTVTRAAG